MRSIVICDKCHKEFEISKEMVMTDLVRKIVWCPHCNEELYLENLIGKESLLILSIFLGILKNRICIILFYTKFTRKIINFLFGNNSFKLSSRFSFFAIFKTFAAFMKAPCLI